ncbi:unnamed protein product [Bemisia tabaci]|uniref:Uncharacterized protein n=1 Tax=Bemisia tabaci TaxID=7038 RepID=A0A9P0AC37_BEMTA|nr:PREDICTED: protein argonaute-3 [Bemisia tabaci]XP_018917780.1 PREDICTED: protein argonaute-3 [Bemisia tabaci]XP_018917781.1 PREDICTED: protein argonaute-3 [Bemisia tabaci]XP_018917782.1 PREDICTED: protein argonaute-3 [Bemisia tabaci]CAH0388616.1 unnamed protein product [Bemisia tabaci]
MTGRGGRGAALESLLQAEAARRPGEDEPQPIRSGGRGAAIFAHVQSQDAAPIGRSGRGMVLPDSSEEQLRPIGRGAASRALQENLPTAPIGRGAILQNVGRGALLSQIDTSSVVSDPSSLKSGTISEITAVTSALAETAITSSSRSSPSSAEPVFYKGSEGTTIQAVVNYLKLDIIDEKGIYEYEVRYNPPIDHRGLKSKLLRQLESTIGNVKNFDGTVLYLPIKLQEPVYTLPCTNPNDESKVMCTIKFKKTHRISECIHFYNVLFNKILNKLGLVQFGRKYFSPAMKKPLPKYQMEVWPGYVTAVDEYEGGLYLNIDVSHRVLRTSTVYDVMRNCIQNSPGNWKDQFTKEILGFSVITRYNNSVYKVDDIDFDLTPAHKFPRHDGTEISYCEYYKQQYEITIRDVNQPMLIHRKRKRDIQAGNAEQLICLVPELCCETGLSDSQRSNFTLMKDLGNVTKPTPEMRLSSYEQYVRSVKSNPEAIKILKDWGLSFTSASTDLQTRVIAPEKILFGKGIEEPANPNADWNRAATSKPLLCPMKMENWAIIYTRKDEGPVRTFEEHMFKSTKQMGIFINKPAMYLLPNDSAQEYLKKLREIIRNGLQIVVIVFPSLREDKYAAVKKLCCSDQAIASQVFLGKTLSKPDKARSIVQKIALQMNCKMGGSLWAVHIPVPPSVKLMVCGMDTYHEGAQKSNSVSAFVASMNESFTRWYSKVALQNKGQEIIDELKLMFSSCLKQFHRVNGKFPDRIIIYRDGVGDGAMKLIRDYEIAQIESVFRVIAPDYNPKFTFIVVQKRINTRIFLRRGRQLENPPPGTILDHSVTRKHYKDFFLVPQLVRQGTVSPTHYVILYDSENSLLKPDMAQKITYKLCHLYYNWPGTIRVPAPCQYAHKLAYLIGQSVKRPHAEVLDDKLFYL